MPSRPAERSRVRKWSRRAFIGAGTAAGGGLVLGVAELAFAPNRLETRSGVELNTWIAVTPDDVVTILIPHCEMGQGAQTALAMMAAEEMGADWSRVRIREAPALDEYANEYVIRGFVDVRVPSSMLRGFDYGTYRLARLFGLQVTGGSSAVRGTGVYGMTVAGAAARDMLIAAAAKRWNVAPSECEARVARPAQCVEAQRDVRRAGGGCRRNAGADPSGVDGAGRLHDPSHRAAAVRHPFEGGRKRRVRHRFHAARHALRRRGDRA
jgi:CO/xanthine dehydrogenase Mo-binding subunit